MTHHLHTRLLHTGSAPFDPETRTAAVSLPAMRTSTVRFADLAALDAAQERKAAGERAVTYGRSGLDTHRALEDVFSQLEGGARTILAPSGLAAITLVFLGLLKAGEHALVADCVYGPVRHLDHALLRGLGIEITYFDPAGANLAELVRPQTRMVYAESPGSLLMQMLDLPALAAQARALGLPLVVDNTWGSGYIYRPLALGADVSVVAGTKYVGGHSDLMLGAVVARDAELGQRLAAMQYALGYSVSADDAWLALRGSRTLPVRMAEHARSALLVCEFLAQRPEVVRIFHPAWPQDPGHALWRRDCTGSNGMMAVELALDTEAGRRFVDALQLFAIGFSWGGYESLVQWVDPAALRPHAYAPAPGNTIVRLHVGLEAVADLTADIEQALQACRAAG
ncbi:cystathionine beta-lyase [Orrella sp. JC864]|uniref:cystathionine beta-lyase n=1 Tax=Orrella sp. JC864 TaxID=3120298 RepID=UPI00142C6C3E